MYFNSFVSTAVWCFNREFDNVINNAVDAFWTRKWQRRLRAVFLDFSLDRIYSLAEVSRINCDETFGVCERQRRHGTRPRGRPQQRRWQWQQRHHSWRRADHLQAGNYAIVVVVVETTFVWVWRRKQLHDSRNSSLSLWSPAGTGRAKQKIDG